jgi:diguanylate cyclase (GGDEF)-like protein
MRIPLRSGVEILTRFHPIYGKLRTMLRQVKSPKSSAGPSRPPGTTGEAKTRTVSQAISDLRFEIAVIGLLVLTIAAICFANLILRNTLVISPARPLAFTTEWHGDEGMGGNSTVSADLRRPLTWSCELRPRYRYPYCAYEVVLDGHSNRGLDLSKFQTVTITLDYRGRADSFRVYLKNYDPRYSAPKDRSTLKYNQIELPVRNGKTIIEAKLEDFKAADWWLQKSRLPYRLGHAQFDNVVALEIDTGNSAQLGPHNFRIESVVLRGNIVPIAQWYLGILGCWIVLICLFLISRILGLQRDLRRRRLLHAVAQGEAQLAQESARRDHLTGLYNRLGVSERYRQMLADASGKPVAIVLIDIDHFKSINDRFGHVEGDAVLAAFAALLQHNVREADLTGRWGGEEFLLIVRVSDARAAVELAEKLRTVIGSASFAHGRLTASFGVYFAETLPDKLGPAISRADRALYAAKEQGRDRVVLHETPSDTAAQKRP